MADGGGGSSGGVVNYSRRIMGFNVPEKVQLHVAMLALQFGYAGFHVVSRAALNMGISKIVFPVYRNILAFLLLLPFAYFLEKYVNFIHFYYPSNFHPMFLFLNLLSSTYAGRSVLRLHSRLLLSSFSWLSSGNKTTNYYFSDN